MYSPLFKINTLCQLNWVRTSIINNTLIKMQSYNFMSSIDRPIILILFSNLLSFKDLRNNSRYPDDYPLYCLSKDPFLTYISNILRCLNISKNVDINELITFNNQYSYAIEKFKYFLNVSNYLYNREIFENEYHLTWRQ